ncbi:phage minor head protein [uncultured Catenibacterium sp.]|uniref:phage minor head protein n=1 Tax=uncultured Catenibacterium sp. TaxID=286142 RepID=UPI00259A0CB7|nr:phage minor head protein [uncultured Catenibacterium sp.]
MGIDVGILKKQIAKHISRGIATSSLYAHIARNIDGASNIGFNKAMRIARTEGHRIQVLSANDAQHAAKAKGCEVVKQWDATLDGRTRPMHRLLDGKLAEIDEPFVVDDMEVMYPGGFGIASQDVNCRCALLQRARWALDADELMTLKERAEYYGLDKTKDFEDYKRKYLNPFKYSGSRIIGKYKYGTFKETNEAIEWAKNYYYEILKKSTATAKISIRTGFKKELVDEVKKIHH